MIAGFVAKAINRPVLIIPVDYPRDSDKARSWIDPKFHNHIYLGEIEDLPHELIHTLDFILGPEKVEELLGVSYDDAHQAMFGEDETPIGYDEEDFADCMAPHLISASQDKHKKRLT